jgi:hypothetical protein
VYSDDGHAIPKVAAFSIAGAIVAAVPLGALPFLDTIRRAHVPPLTLGLLLLPQALVLTLPAALLFAIPLALKRQQPSARLVRRIVVLSTSCAAITFALIAWIMPEANQAYRVQAYRELASGQQELGRGPNETGFTALTRQIESLRTFHGAESAVRRLKYVYQVRLAGILRRRRVPVPGVRRGVRPAGHVTSTIGAGVAPQPVRRSSRRESARAFSVFLLSSSVCHRIAIATSAFSLRHWALPTVIHQCRRHRSPA